MRWLTLPLLLTMLAGCAAPTAATLAGPRRATDRNLDLAIDGDGYFIVQTTAGGFLFTRNGELAVAGTGELVNTDGYKLYPPVNVPTETSKITISPEGVVRVSVTGGVDNQLAGQIVLSRFAHADKLERDGIYYMPTETSGDPITGKPATKGLGTIHVGQLED